MRGLPPVPDDVAQLTQTWDVDGLPCTTSWWLLDVGRTLSNPAAQSAVLADYFARLLPSLLELMHDNCRATACRILLGGLSTTEEAPPNHGRWSGGTTHNAALGLSWKMQGRGRRGWSLTYVPGLPDPFYDEGSRLSSLGWGNALASGTDFLNAANGIVYPPGPPLILGTVQRQRNGVPLGSASFNPFVAVNPVTKVVTIRRRIPSGRALSPF